MKPLNFPSYKFKTFKKDNNIFIYDIIRNKTILLTPEEWVRQHMIHYFVNDLNYPKGLIKVESSLCYNTRLKRSDIIIYNNLGKPHIVVECKARLVKINQSTLEQISTYNKSLKASILILSNGIIHYIFKVTPNGEIINLTEIPKFERI